MSAQDSKVHVPRSLAEALAFLHDRPSEGWRPLAGGTDALVPIYRDCAAVDHPWLSLHRLKRELGEIRREVDGLRIGALSTIFELDASEDLAAAFPAFRAMCREFASPAIRNRATVAGNIANGSPASDLAPILLAHDASLELASVRGTRQVALDKFWTGYRTDVAEADELIVAVHLPWPSNAKARQHFRKVAPRASNSIAIVNFAARGSLDESGRWTSIRLAFGCMGPNPLRANAAEAVVEGRRFEGEVRAEFQRVLGHELGPISDHRATAAYRMQVAQNLAAAFLAGESADDSTT